MQNNKKVSMSVIRRLPKYYKCLGEMLDLEVERTSSKELSKKMSITASQIRQDFSCFGGFGLQGYGYNVRSLYEKIGKILGIDETFNIIIVGAGNIGRALANYKKFQKKGFKVIGIFDIDPMIIGKEVGEFTVSHIDTIEIFLAENIVDIAAICVPYEYTRTVAKQLIQLNIKGIWNFSSIDLNLESLPSAMVENVHLIDSLMVLGYKLRDASQKFNVYNI